MRGISMKRRNFILSSAVLLSFNKIFALAAKQALSSQDYQQLTLRWVDIITGRNLINHSDNYYKKQVAALDNKVKNILQDLIKDNERKSIFQSIDLTQKKSPALTKTSRAILTLATAWVMPSSQYYQNQDLLKDSISAFQDFIRLSYNPEQSEYGNWWDWESGAARAVADMMCVLYAQLPKPLLQSAADAIAYYIPDPHYQQFHSKDKALSTGANRIDLCRATICAAIASGNAERLKRGLSGLSDTWKIVTIGDGFYQDGSFIQHAHTPYTGAYGDVLISGLSMLLTLVGDSHFNIALEDRVNLYRCVDEAYIPAMIEGQVFDNLRGRSVSRITEPASFHGASIMQGILLLAQTAPASYATRWKSICAGWLKRNQYDHFNERGSIHYLALIRDALTSTKEIAPASKTPKMFAAMDRLVHRTPHWTVAISMCSERISWYECGNEENNWGSRTGSGMRYLYLPHDMGQFEDEFWPTMDYAAPVGTTVDTQPLLPKAAGEWGKNTPKNEWTGGITQGDTSLAAMHLIGPDNNGLTARKVWLGTEEMLIELVTDVHTTAEQAITVVEHRNLGETNDKTLIIDNQTITEPQTLKNPQRAELSQVAEYFFLTPVTLKAKIEQRSGSWIHINPTKKVPHAQDIINRYWATMQVQHQSEQGVAWVIIPKGNQEKNGKSQKPEIAIVQNDKNAQCVQLMKQQSAWVIWQAGKYMDWIFSQPCIALAKQTASKLLLTIADPTQKQETLRIAIPKKWKTNHKEITYQHQDNTTQIVINTKQKYGSSFTFELHAIS